MRAASTWESRSPPAQVEAEVSPCLCAFASEMQVGQTQMYMTSRRSQTPRQWYGAGCLPCVQCACLLRAPLLLLAPDQHQSCQMQPARPVKYSRQEVTAELCPSKTPWQLNFGALTLHRGHKAKAADPVQADTVSSGMSKLNMRCRCC